MTREKLIKIENKARVEIREENRDLLSWMFKQLGNNVAATLEELTIMHTAIVKALDDEGIDRKIFLDSLKNNTYSSDDFDVYRFYINEYILDLVDEEFSFSQMYNWFIKTFFRKKLMEKVYLLYERSNMFNYYLYGDDELIAGFMYLLDATRVMLNLKESGMYSILSIETRIKEKHEHNN